MRWQLIDVTPEMARKWLAGATQPIRWQNVAMFAGLMSRGEFKAMPLGILFYEDGRIQNGHHRLHAIVKYGKPVRMWVYGGQLDETVRVYFTTAAEQSGQQGAAAVG